MPLGKREIQNKVLLSTSSSAFRPGGTNSEKKKKVFLMAHTG
jgi:hypothetical protein